MLKYQGHTFADGVCLCCIADERVVSVDPTGTGALRSAFNSALAIKWRGMRVLVRKMIVDQDILSMGSKGLMAIANPAIQGGSTKTQMFQRWFDYIAGAQVLNGDGSFMRDYIGRGYAAGRAFAQGEVGMYSTPLAQDREDTIFQLAVVELQGIVEAVSQQAVRAVTNGILHGQRPAGIARAALAAIDKVAFPRSTALVELLVVKAFSEASLDVYQSAGVRKVGLVPETLLAKATDARKVTPSGRFGTRSRTGEAPGERTIQRIKKQERSVETALVGGLVRVKTAGDKKVCKVCRAIAKRGPYKINTARALIPAHPRCRCVFIPVASKKKAKAQDEVKDNDFEESQHPRGPDGKFGSGGGGNTTGIWTKEEGAPQIDKMRTDIENGDPEEFKKNIKWNEDYDEVTITGGRVYPALQVRERSTGRSAGVLVGKQGDAHGDVASAHGIDSELVAGGIRHRDGNVDYERGFVQKKKYYRAADIDLDTAVLKPQSKYAARDETITYDVVTIRTKGTP